MIMAPWKKALVLATSLTFVYACSGKDSGSNDNPAPAAIGETTTPSGDSATGTPATGSTAVTEQNCEIFWKQYVAARPAGLILAYSVKSETKSSEGSVIQQSTLNYEEQVLESNDSYVLNKKTTKIPGLALPNVTESKFTKAQWFAGCDQVGTVLPELPESTSLEILEKSVKSIQVAAGSFNTNYVKGEVSDSGLGGSASFENWTAADGSSLLIKSTVSTTTNIASSAVLNVYTTELTKLVRP